MNDNDCLQRPGLCVLPHQLAVCYLPPDAAVPEWAYLGEFRTVTRTPEELSIVCDFDSVPSGVAKEGPWACIQVDGPLDFALTGILANLTAPLAQAGISIFALSTYRTDYLLVRSDDLVAAVDTLLGVGYAIRP